MSCANVKKTFDLNSLCVQARITYSKDKVCYYQLLGSNLWKGLCLKKRNGLDTDSSNPFKWCALNHKGY